MTIFADKLPDSQSQWLFSRKKLEKDYKFSSISFASKAASSFSPITDKISQVGSANQIVKIIQQGVNFIAHVTNNLLGKQIVHYCDGLCSTLKIFCSVKGIQEILNNSTKKDLKGINLHQRNLSIAEGIFQLISSTLSFVNLLEYLTVIDLAASSISMGATKVLPFPILSNGIDLIKSGIQIANGALRLHEIHELKKKINYKRKQFRIKNGDITTFLKNHLNDMEQKQKNDFANLISLETNIGNTYIKVEKSHQEYFEAKKDLKASKGKNWVTVLRKTWDVHRKKSHLFAEKKVHDDLFNSCQELRAKCEARIIKRKVWIAIGNHYEALKNEHANAKKLDSNGLLEPFTIEKDDPLSQLLEHKKKKWKTQLKNCNWSYVIDGFGISIHTIAATAFVASSVLAMTGIGTLPAVLAMSATWFFLAFGQITLEFLNDMRSPYRVPQTDFNAYMIDPTKNGYSIHPNGNGLTYI